MANTLPQVGDRDCTVLDLTCMEGILIVCPHGVPSQYALMAVFKTPVATENQAKPGKFEHFQDYLKSLKIGPDQAKLHIFKTILYQFS